MLACEKEGLDFIKSTNTISTPEVLALDQFDIYPFLLLEYIDAKPAEDSDFITLGRQLGEFHNKAGLSFGGIQNNFIGSLPQSNQTYSEWQPFYLWERLIPQLRTAVDAGHLPPAEIPNEEKWDPLFDQLLPEVLPSPLHGDLWSGNFLIQKDGSPFLIDPSTYYGHSEVDLAMSQLFGGFGPGFYESYREVVEPNEGEEERIKLYQLYYLLVHLNMFGLTYKPSVMGIIKDFF
ncbi:UNVERIFIED_CONTAM: hypothetical protein GTU68_031138 [Idotea baltica]|nr:hypothetical protein [Idotea baltica]